MTRKSRIMQGTQCCSSLKNNKHKYERCITKQFWTEDGNHSRRTPFKICRLLKIKKKKQGRSLGLPIDFSGVARGLELAKFLWAARGWQMWELLEKEAYVS